MAGAQLGCGAEGEADTRKTELEKEPGTGHSAALLTGGVQDMERPQMHLHLPNWLLSLISNVAPRHPKGGTYHASLDKALVCCPVRTFPLSGKPSPPRQILERRESPAGHTEVCLPLNVFLSCDPSPIRSADLSFRGKAIPAESRLFAFQKLRPQRAVITENSGPEGGALAKPWAVGRKPQLCS